jgi:hypothetical protein
MAIVETALQLPIKGDLMGEHIAVLDAHTFFLPTKECLLIAHVGDEVWDLNVQALDLLVCREDFEIIVHGFVTCWLSPILSENVAMGGSQEVKVREEHVVNYLLPAEWLVWDLERCRTVLYCLMAVLMAHECAWSAFAMFLHIL